MDKPRCTAGFFRRVLLFQSLRQFVYFLIIIAILNIILGFISPFLSISSYYGAAILSAFAVLFYLWRIFPHEMMVSTSEMPNAQEEIERLVKKIFKETLRTPTTVVYKENLPEILTWDEARVEISILPGLIKIVGPGVTLSWLYKSLKADPRKESSDPMS